MVNPAVQYMAYEWLTQRHAALKQKRLARAGVKVGRVKLSAGEVFMLGEPRGEGGGAGRLQLLPWSGSQYALLCCCGVFDTSSMLKTAAVLCLLCLAWCCHLQTP